MRIFDYTGKSIAESDVFPDEFKKSKALFILCRPQEISVLRDEFCFDESTVLDCADLDESVRYTSFDGYDFISIVHIEMLEDSFILREINMYASQRYIVLVMPEHDSPRLSAMEDRLLDYAKNAGKREGGVSCIYYWIFHNILADFSDMLEALEDRMQALFEEIVSNVSSEQFARINKISNLTYTAKKQLRALSYLGDQMLFDENKVIPKQQLHYFHNVNTRLKKLYDFAESLYNLSSEMLSTYDSRLTMKTNDTVNKLAVLTLFFGPLTVITGIYGMNFKLMPELDLPFGYPLVLTIMGVVSLILFILLKKKKWL